MDGWMDAGFICICFVLTLPPQVGEAVSTRDIEDQQRARGIAVVGASDGAEALLPGLRSFDNAKMK